jgi:MarR family transcriptional regulator, 2-MHQ and catechol-resistance regulon repressor
MSQAEDLYHALIKSHILIEDSDERFFNRFHLGKTRYYALVHLGENPGMSPGELSQRLLCTKGNATRIMKIFEKDGYLRREVDAADRRGLHLYLTSSGERRLAEARAATRAFHEQRFAGLEAGEVESLYATLTKLNRQMDESLHGENGPTGITE